ncbi:UDP-N-acetylmuramate--L-alanine ligase [Carbonactinospora thermoautotrophica]|uniref:UDP-N-acetylmuramate--L-alanine ligase n=2 Tax=Carbonactinospora thermoautotrophica TaxID=1469144 RepID=UPI0027DFF9B3|nr:UDP-N-acetylmuramate--L-alanine ligase [Carbonactinospora thermoautotrophica]MCX9190758.1 UDP-N-acetylmuramate--L-alanine ligase [Carbonactinospora thermoautotrophica]
MMVPAPAQTVPAEKLGRVHFIGIGGVGMSSIARIFLARGIPTSGSELKETRTVEALRALGAKVYIGHAPEHLDGVDTVVVSTAIRESNIELIEARRRDLLILPRAAALASLMEGRRAVAVAGTHGKTTTTSMLTVALQHCGADPSFSIGGQLNESGTNAHDGSGEIFVAEADESDGSFLLYSPFAAIVTNVEPDHLDHYGSPEAVDKAFMAFADQIKPGGFLVTCADDPGARRLAESARSRGIDVRTYGESAGADFQVVDVTVRETGSTFRVVRGEEELARISLQIPGRHNALNATAAFATALGLGFDPRRIAAGLAAFTGARRRFEFKGVARGVRVYDDYGHHPTELIATIEAARNMVRDGRLIVCFQPHRYTRTAAFCKEFGQALGLADVVVVMEVYSAGEDPIPGATGAGVAAHVPLPPDRVVFEPSWSAVAGRLAELARPGDLVLTLGAGDVTMIGPELLQALACEAKPG